VHVRAGRLKKSLAQLCAPTRRTVRRVDVGTLLLAVTDVAGTRVPMRRSRAMCLNNRAFCHDSKTMKNKACTRIFTAFRFALAAAAVFAMLAGVPVHAAGWAPSGAFVQAGASPHAASSATVGASWPWAWQADAWGSRWSVQTEAFASFWRTRDFSGGHQAVTQLGVLPALRARFDGGSSPWFVEGGIGISVTDRIYRTPERTFSTRFNFSDSLALGRSFGEGNRHELSLRLQHTSNAGIKKPNPGEDFAQLRYAALF
jgi:lipid A 3-O-deacylase